MKSRWETRGSASAYRQAWGIQVGLISAEWRRAVLAGKPDAEFLEQVKHFAECDERIVEAAMLMDVPIH